MVYDVSVRRIAVGVGKVLAFIVVTEVLLEFIVFTALRAVSATFWSQYDGRGLNEPWFLSSSIAILGVVLFVCFVFLRYIDKRDWSYVRFSARPGLRLFAMGLLILNIFLMGCLLALVCVLTGSLWAAIGLHFGWNFFLYLFHFPVSGATYPNPLFKLEYNRYSLISGSAFGPEDSAVVTALIALLLFGTLLWLRKQRQITIRIGVDILEYFKEIAEETGIPYQNLINLYLRDCVINQKKPSFKWAS